VRAGWWRQECRHSLWGGRGGWRRRGVTALGAAVGLGFVAGRELVEEEAGALGDVPGVSGGICAGGVLEAGGVLDGEAVCIEGVGLDDFLVGEAEAVIEGLFLLMCLAAEGGDGVAEEGAVGGDPAFGFEFGGVFEGGGVVGSEKLGGTANQANPANLWRGIQKGQ
jgi:hypothetical protein